MKTSEFGEHTENNTFGTYHYKNGKLHCTTGPAVTYPDGTKLWFINDEEFIEDEWKTAIKE